MNNAIFITVRNGSTRLPNKALINFNGMTVIEYIIQRHKNAKVCDSIILCTTENKNDDSLIDIAKKNNINFFRGSETDKLERWKGAADEFDVKYIVTADGDDLFCEPKLIDLAFEQFEKSQPDFIQANGVICGAFTYGIKSDALRKACEIKDTSNTEMMWVFFTQTNLFKIEELQKVPMKFYRNDIRMTLDYKEDLDFFNAIIKKGWSGNYLTLDEILEIIEKEPYLKDINFYRQQEFLNNQKNKTILKVKDNFSRE
jgi:spore coat polysaccharide biosynthesis protein SpsF